MAQALQANEVTFEFNGFNLTTLTDDNNQIWFYAKEIADILEYSGTAQLTKRLDDDETQLFEWQFATGRRTVSLINESGLYNATIGSKKPEAKAFKKWVTSEVIPSIRKTGQYNLPPANESFINVAAEAKAIHELATLFGLNGNQALLRTDKIVQQYHGISPLKLLDVQLVAPIKDKTFTPTDLGLQIDPTKSAIWVNKRLEDLGYQEKFTTRKGFEWNPTELGKQYCELLDTGKAHSNGAPILQIKWYSSVLSHL